MIGSGAIPQQSKQRRPKHRFLVHILKIARLSVPSSNLDCSLHQNARKDAVKVTALYNSQQVALGDFPILMNECIIDQKLTCQFNTSTSETQSKLHLYIDQTDSSGLTGHLALDLQEFIREGETETYLKYPLHANTSRHCRGPVLKMMTRYLGKTDVDASFDEDNDIFLLPNESIERLHSSRICSSEDHGCKTQGLASSGHSSLSGRMQPYRLDADSLLQLEGALSNIDEKLKALVSSFKSKDYIHNGDYLAGEVECQSSTTSPLLSSFHTGTSMDSRSEAYEEQCTDSDDVFDLSFDLGSSVYPLPISKHARTLSDISSLRYPQVFRHMRNISTEEAVSESWFSQSNTLSAGENLDHKHGCQEECFMCSSAHALQSYQGLQASLSRSKSLSVRPKSLDSNSSQLALVGSPAPLQRQCSKKSKEAQAPVARKGPGLLRSLFGAVVLAGVSILGARNSSLSKDRAQSSGVQKNFGQTSRASFPAGDIRSERSIRQRYSFRR